MCDLCKYPWYQSTTTLKTEATTTTHPAFRIPIISLSSYFTTATEDTGRALDYYYYY